MGGAGLAALQLCGAQVCVLHRLTGWPCLTCGSSRALVALATGHPWEALSLQPLAVAGFAGAAAGCGAHAFELLLRRRVVALRLERREWRALGVALAVAVALNWCYLVWRGV